MRSLFLLVLTAAAAVAQPITAGIRGGAPLTDFFTAVKDQNVGFTSQTHRYVVGPTVEVRLPFGLMVTGDALYRSASYAANLGSTVSNGTMSAWEFPIMLKYRFPTPVAKPFVGGGIAWDRISGVKQSVLSAVGLTNKSTGAQYTKGLVMGVGVDIHLILHFSPEIRYIRWGSTDLVNPVTLVRGSQNEAQFLLGVTF